MFEVDSQTIKDLQILPNSKGERAIISLFDDVISYGGRQQLERLFRAPLSSADQIRERVECLQHIEAKGISLGVDCEILDFIEYYFSLYHIPSRYSRIDGLRKNWAAKIKANNQYYVITRSVKLLAEILENLHRFALSNSDDSAPALFNDISSRILCIVESQELSAILTHGKKRFSSFHIEKFDHILRYKKRDEVRELLRIIYTIDVFQGVIKAKSKHGLTFASLGQAPGLAIKNLRHPLLGGSVANDISVSDQNVVFITGANMSGKSTFMKAFGVSLYLAHMGFPVPADEMTFTPFDGLFTTINVPDDLSLGYSHFYSEVKRIKAVAERIATGKRYAVVFDELFRGTNVKDAHEATVSIIEMFAAARNNLFLFSSHIIEAAEELAHKIPDIQFRAFKTELHDSELSYSYLMEEGISNDRFGMYIIRREGIDKLLTDL